MDIKAIQSLLKARLAGIQRIPTGRAASMPLLALVAIYSLSVVTSLPGLAVSPILGDLETVFSHASQLEVQMLASLPSLVIIPFVLIAGKLSLNFSKKRLMVLGLSIFFASSVVYLLVTHSITLMLIDSVLLGIGAGLVIPLSTGLIADNFSGDYRTKQLGIVSAISNLSLVLATMLAGYLAGIDWHYSFLVYCLSAVSLGFAFKLPKDATPTPHPVKADVSVKQRGMRDIRIYGRIFRIDWPLGLMRFYFLITVVVLVIPLNLSIYMERYAIGGTDASGTLISAFFLAVMLPGLFINKIISGVKEKNNLYALGIILLGLLLMLFHSLWLISIGVLLAGFGYGVMQPLVYDRTADSVAPQRVTFALALVMAMNYGAIIIYPFLQKLVEMAVGTKSIYVPFGMSIVICAVMFWPQYRLLRRMQREQAAAKSDPVATPANGEKN